MAFSIEIKHLGYDQEIRRINEFRDRLFLRKVLLERRLERGLSIAWQDICSADELDVWAEQVERAAAAGETFVDGPGIGQTRILPATESGSIEVLRSEETCGLASASPFTGQPNNLTVSTAAGYSSRMPAQ